MRRSFGTVLASLIVLAIAGAMLVSAEGDVVYYACVNDVSGAMFMVDGPEDCMANQTPVQWNQTGPVGPEGPPGVLGFYKVHEVYSVPPETMGILSVLCNDGDQVTGGDWHLGCPHCGTTETIQDLGGEPSEQAIGWTKYIKNGNEWFEVEVHVVAVCADLTP